MSFSIGKSMGAKIVTLALGAAMVMALTYVWVIPKVSDSIYDEKRLKTRHVVETAVSVAEYFVKQEADGKLTRDQAQKMTLDVLRELRYETNDYFWINDLDGVMLMHPFSKDLIGKPTAGIKDADGKAFFAEMVSLAKSAGKGFVDYKWTKPGADKAVDKVSYIQAIPAWQWLVGSGIYVDDVEEQIGHLTMIIVGVVAIIFALTVLASLMLARSVTTPLKKTVAMIKDIAQGQGDLTARMEVMSKDEIGVLAAEFNRFVEKLHDIIVQVRQSTDVVSQSTMEISQGNQDLSERVQQQASAIEETASAMEEMTSSVKQEADHARQANQMAQKTAHMAQEGGQVVQRTIEAMAAVSESSKKISEIINVVNEIAFQTNLLALNAAVEAARAGEAGRGFAVVAGEVRNLAGRSATAAKEIQGLITDSVVKVEQGNQLVTESGRLLTEIIANVQNVADIAGEIDAAIQEQAMGIEEVNKAVAQMDQGVQQNAALVEEAASASEEMASAADVMRQQMAGFKVNFEGQPLAAAKKKPTKPAPVAAARPMTHRPATKPAAKPAAKAAPAKSAAKASSSDDFFEGVELEGFEEF